MASSPPPVACDDAHEKIEPLSVYRCIFCNKLLNGQAKILECLHVICHECMENEIDNTRLKCKCLTVTDITNDLITDYPTVSSRVLKTKKCESCDKKACKYCVKCEQLFCKSCVKIHLKSTIGRAHGPDLVLSYPMIDQFMLCLGCSKKISDVYCTKCSVIICSLCHLSSHRDHDFKVLNELYDEMKTNVDDVLQKLKKKKENVITTLECIPKVTQKLEIQKKLAIDEIDEAAQVLIDRINKSALELKEKADDNVINFVRKIINNEKVLKDTLSQIQYDINLIETVVGGNKDNDFIKLSKLVLKKHEQIENISAFELVSKFDFDITFKKIKSICECILEIEHFGMICVTSGGLPETIDFVTPDSNHNGSMSSTTADSNDNSYSKDYCTGTYMSSNESSQDSISSVCEPLADCSCCNQWEEASKLIFCTFCIKYFHHNCHIPTVVKNTNVDESQTKWKCTLCKDITKYAKVINQRDDMNGIFHVGESDTIIMERILMELFCQNDDSEHYRELPDADIYPAYYRKVSSPISLNDVKKKLESTPSYTSLIQFLLDVKKVFSNGLKYYAPSDPYYKSAEKLQIYFHRLINRWIPKFKNDNRLSSS